MTARPTVFIHTNHKQMLGALVSQHSLKRNSRNPDAFDVRIIDTADHPFLAAKEGQEFLRDGGKRVWHMEDLQSFTPLRFLPPQLMGYEGRAVVIDPDIFAVGDVGELLDRDMEGKAIFCRPRAGAKGLGGCLASSVMLLDCAKLTHWRVEEAFEELFRFERDYMDWICLKLEPRETLGLFEDYWNDFDRLGDQTRLLHNTKRQTQPWKTGLPVDFVPAGKRLKLVQPKSWLRFIRSDLLGLPASPQRYKSHPDPRQEAFFFGLLRECLENGTVTEAFLRAEMAANHVRQDAFEVMERSARQAA
ncbi:hypothetical protein [Aquibaculum sediminis]|uniref:hypothetical protein n=1 Tax=Aquibaculum sediminis TaxID=3231907 RepID=UPI003455B1A5